MRRRNADTLGLIPQWPQVLGPWVLALLVSASSTQAHAQDKPVINWMVTDIPPTSIPVDGKLTDGYVDVLLKMLFAEMPEEEHRIVVTPVARTWVTLSNGNPTCFTTALITPERERIAYSTAMRLMPPLQIVARTDAISKLPVNDKGEVLPASLFDRSDLRGLITPKRSYSALLDALLDRRSPKSGIKKVVAAGSGSNMLQMLSLGRADYTLEYDHVLAYQQARQPGLMQGKDLKSLPIAGSEPMLAGIACPHTEWGRQMIVRIDSIVARISQRPDYQAALNRWFTPETNKRYQKAKQEFLKQRAVATDPSHYPVWPLPK